MHDEDAYTIDTCQLATVVRGVAVKLISRPLSTAAGKVCLTREHMCSGCWAL